MVYASELMDKSVKILDFPALRQACDWDCGATAIQSVLAYYGIDIRGEAVIRFSGATKDRGTPIVGMERIVKNYGLSFKAGKMTADEIRKYIDGGIPVVLALLAWSKEKIMEWENDWDDGHFVVAIGYDKYKIFFEDPSVFSRTYLTYSELEQRWHDMDIDGNRYDHWGMAVFGREPSYDLSNAQHME